MSGFDDLDKVAGASAVDEGLGFDWASEVEGVTGEGETTVGAPPIPRSDFYIGNVASVDARMQPESFDKPEIEGKVTFKVDEGVEGTVGRLITGTIVMAPRRTKAVREGDKWVQVPMTEAEQKKENERFAHMLNRVGRVMGLGTSRPAARSVEAVKAWLAPAAGKQVVFTAWSRKKDGFSEVLFDNIRAFADPAPNPKKPGEYLAGKSAVEQAREELAAAASKGGRRGTQAAGRTAASATDFA